MANKQTNKAIIDICKGRFVRFGTYGEPSLIPINLIDSITKVAKNWTGYSHQWKNNNLSKYFMASVENINQAIEATNKGFSKNNDLIDKWLRNKNTLEYLSIWEVMNNPSFNSPEFEGIKTKVIEYFLSINQSRLFLLWSIVQPVRK